MTANQPTESRAAAIANGIDDFCFDAFFRKAMRWESNPKGCEPYDYQRRLACGEWRKGDDERRIRQEWLRGGTECRSKLISIPTGLGKTAGTSGNDLNALAEEICSTSVASAGLTLPVVNAANISSKRRLTCFETPLHAVDRLAYALASGFSSGNLVTHESSRANPAMAGIATRGAASATYGVGAGERLLEHVDGGATGKPCVAEGITRPARATRTVETTWDELAFSEIAELLASRAREIQSGIAVGAYADLPLDESLLALLHRKLCAELAPDWAGKWRNVEVTVGAHVPPACYKVATALRDYAEDLAARWEFLFGEDEELFLETLAFAESRYLSIHPFKDFNGRVARLWLREILRRARLPEVRLEVRSEEERTACFAALHATDRHDLAPLKTIWRQRFAEAV